MSDGGGGGGDGSGAMENAFIMIDGHAEAHVKPLRDDLAGAGFLVSREVTLQLTEAQARSLLELEVAAGATEAAAVAAAGAAAKTAKKPAPAAKGKPAPPALVTELRPAEAASLSGPKVTVLAVSRVDAVNELRGRVGASTPDEWSAIPGSWAAKYTVDGEGGAPYRVLHVPLSAAHAAQFLTVIDEAELLLKTLSETLKTSKEEKSHWVDPDFLMSFAFPAGQQHPRSTGRLIVFAMYGPFNAAGKLTSGICGRHVATDSELRAMIDSIEVEDMLGIYVKEKG